jgi:hypothetical protein
MPPQTDTSDSQQMSVDAFARAIKTKMPQYKNIPDDELTNRILAKYPQYRSRVKLPAPNQPSRMTLLGRGNQLLEVNPSNYQSFVKTNAVEAPKTLGRELVSAGQTILGMPGQVYHAVIDPATEEERAKQAEFEKAHGEAPGTETSGWKRVGLAARRLSGIDALEDAIKDYRDPAKRPSVEQVLSAAPEAIGGGAGVVLAGEAGAKAGAGLVKAGTEILKRAPEGVRTTAQTVMGVGPERTTQPLVDKFKEASTKAEAAQTEENATTEAKNREKAEKYQDERRDVASRNEKQTLEHAADVEEVKARNQAKQDLHTERGQLAQQIDQGSKQVGEDIKALERKVREQGNQKYAEVRAKVSNDGTMPDEVIQAVQHAKKSIIRGSEDSVRQFSSIIRRGPDPGAEEAIESVRNSADPAAREFMRKYDQLDGEGAEVEPLTFNDWQGYSSELGQLMAKGNLPGDVYQAVKYVKESVDKQITTIAERHGAEGDLKAANAYWADYLKTFYDRPSAAADTLRRVGKLDPEYYAEPFIRGKSAKTGLAAIKNYDPGLADRIEDLRTKSDRFHELPKTLKLENEPNAPEPIEEPKRPEFKAPKQVERPTYPTEKDVTEAKTKELKKSVQEIGRFSKYDAAIMGSSVIGPFLGKWSTLLIDPTLIVARKGVGKVINRPGVIEWLSRPSAEDLRILKESAPEVQTEVKQNMKEFIAEEKAHGRSVPVAPEVKSWLGDAVKGLVDRGKQIIKGEKGEAGAPGSVNEDLDSKLKDVWKNSSSVGAGEANQFQRAKQELYPGKRELTNEQMQNVSRRAMEITAEQKAQAGAEQGVQSPQQKIPPKGAVTGSSASEDPLEMERRRAGENEQGNGKVASLRRRYNNLKSQYEREVSENNPDRFNTRTKMLKAEQELADEEGKE